MANRYCWKSGVLRNRVVSSHRSSTTAYGPLLRLSGRTPLLSKNRYFICYFYSWQDMITLSKLSCFYLLVQCFSFYCYQRSSLKFTFEDEKLCGVFPSLRTDQLRSWWWPRSKGGFWPSRGRRTLPRTHCSVDRTWCKTWVRIIRLIILVMNCEK